MSSEESRAVSETRNEAAFPFREFEPKWQKRWEESRAFRTENPSGSPPTAPKYYILDMFPYPSGSGLHVGHPEGYTATDILARYKRMRGFNVLHPMGWDAFGLPAEQYAIQTGTHPAVTTRKNIGRFKEQIRRLGFSYDWEREVDTTDPEYFRWTQWIFLKLFEKGLAYESEAPVWWCEELGCVLANEEVIDGKSERGGYPVVRRPMRQWMLKITAYADRLLDGLQKVDWPDAIKEMQRNWIGKSVGAEAHFVIESGAARGEKLKVFTTRPDTLFGATYMVIAPEHPLLDRIVSEERMQEVNLYRERSSKKSELERTELAKEKTGVFTGGYAVNPVNGARIPIWTADYVLAGYGTGAIMAVPAHDQRDFDFAQKYALGRVTVVRPKEGAPAGKTTGLEGAFEDNGVAAASRNDQGLDLNGLETLKAKEAVIGWLEAKGLGRRAVHYKLRDWLFSRQRYWGEPIPIVHCGNCGHVPVPESELPLRLPEMEDFKPTGNADPPLAKATAWVNTPCPHCKRPGRRETNTMPQWAGSCWYYLRYIDPKNSRAAVDPVLEKYWMNVDLYVGGAEHAVLHLLYSRFWHKVLYDFGFVSTDEPFQKLVNQGIILGEDGQKMSKSRGNVVNPDEVIDLYGADSMRLFEMFMGPLEQSKAWSVNGTQGVYRFLGRVWRLFVDETGALRKEIRSEAPPADELKILHRTIAKVTQDLDRMAFNTAISALMVFVNEVSALPQRSRASLETFLTLLSPLAPHLAEELWERMGHKDLVCRHSWPAFDPALLVENDVEVPVQINGKIRAKIRVPKGLSQEELARLAVEAPDAKKFLEGKTVRRLIAVPDRLVNIVVDA